VAKVVTVPVTGFIVAAVVLLLLQVPPVTASANVAVPHTRVGPVMAEGIANTVITKLAMQPPLVVYLIVDVPAETPVTDPVAAFTVATPVLRLFQLPLATVSPNITMAPWHIEGGPVIGANGLTVMITKELQPPGVT
jgi:hypothetical protein